MELKEDVGLFPDVSELSSDKSSWQALIRLYSTLLEVDKRNNPDLYQPTEDND